MQVFIYALNDPDTGKCRYVGKSKNPRKRLVEHMCPCYLQGNNAKERWIWRLMAQGKSPVLEILDSVPENEWELWEREYIRLFRALGLSLVNTMDGGRGVTSGTRLSERTRKRMARSRTGKKLSEEHRQNIRNGVLSSLERTQKKI